MRQFARQQVTRVQRMDDQLVCLTPRQVFNPLRRFLREVIAWMRPDVMDGENQGIAAQQRHREIKPKVGALIMDDVGVEFMDLAN